MTVFELEKLYHGRSIRTDVRILEGREPITRYPESRIISEMEKLAGESYEARSIVERCRKDHEAEMRHLSLVFRLPLGNFGYLKFNPNYPYTPQELSLLLDLFSTPRTFAEREFLVEIVDIAIDVIDAAKDKQSVAMLAATLVELDRTKTVKSPVWILDILRGAVNGWISSPAVADTEMVLPLLTLAFIDEDWKLQRRAQRIINRCYIESKEGKGSAESICLSTAYSSYLNRFSTRKIAKEWCRLIGSLNELVRCLPIISLLRLLIAASRIEEFTRLPESSKRILFDHIVLAGKSSGFPYQLCLDKLAPSIGTILAKAL